MLIQVKKGLDIPIAGKPVGSPQRLPKPEHIALNCDPFDDIRFKLLAKAGDTVKIGQPLIENKACAGLVFVSPAGGVISEVRRGLKRRLLNIVIRLDDSESYYEHGALNPLKSTREEILALFLRSGLFPHIRVRPFDLVASLAHLPRAIFVRALETLPFVPSAEMQLEGHEPFFQIGLDTLTKLTEGKVHVVYSESSPSAFFPALKNVVKHTASGPHPAGSSSIHIHHIAPIKGVSDCVWVLSVLDVLTIGKMMREGRYFTERIISFAGPGVPNASYFKARAGFPLKTLPRDQMEKPMRFISGDPLTGTQVEEEDFLGFYHTSFCAIPENSTRERFHFLGLGTSKYSATRAYASGHKKAPKQGFFFTTNQHGEERAFIDARVYEKVMPMRIPTMHLIKAILTEDFELAERLGFLEVAREDFALATFICPSKIEMMDIVKKGLQRYAREMGY